jgi:hypothetical protein
MDKWARCDRRQQRWARPGSLKWRAETGAGDVVGARAFGEQAVVAGAVQAFWQHADEEAADELVCGERHALVSIAALDAKRAKNFATLAINGACAQCRGIQ